jgi:hypothetical protein
MDTHADTHTDKKFHTDHFTCSICPVRHSPPHTQRNAYPNVRPQTLFGPQDSYYEHEDSVYCHFHYSTRFAHRCAGCDTAILKQFVEVNRNMREEAWHPECYMMYVSLFLLLTTISSFASSSEAPTYFPSYFFLF